MVARHLWVLLVLIGSLSSVPSVASPESALPKHAAQTEKSSASQWLAAHQTWLVIAGGAVVAAGTLLVLFSQGGEAKAKPTDLGMPPGDPVLPGGN